MSETDFLKLKKHDNVETNTEKFDIENYLNGNWDKINENAKKVNTDISNIKKEQETQNTNIEENNSKIVELQTEKAKLETELKEMQEDFYQNSIRGQASGEYIHVEDSSNCRARIGIGGNHEQETSTQTENYVDDREARGKTISQATSLYLPIVNLKAGDNYYFKIFDKDNQLLQNSMYLAVEFYDVNKTKIQDGPLGFPKSFTEEVVTKIKYAKIYYNGNDTDKAIGNAVIKKIGLKITSNASADDIDLFVPNMPSTDYPSEIKTVGSNVNIFDKDNTNIKNWYIDTSNKKIASGNSENRILIQEIKPNTTYTISKKLSTFIVATCTNMPTLNSSTTQAQRNDNATKITIASGSSDKYLVVQFKTQADTLTEQEILDSIKIVEGTEVGEYSKYGQGSVKVTKCNKNLINKNLLTNYQILEDTGKLLSNNTRLITPFIYLKKGTYSLSCNLSRFAYAIYNLDKSFNCFVTWKAFPNQIVLNSDCYIKIEFIINPTGSEQVSIKDITYLQLEKGNTTNYEEHEEQSYIMPIQQPMRSIGDIRDTFIKKENKWYERHYVQRLILNGTEGWNYDKNNNRFYFAKAGNKGSGYIMSSHYLRGDTTKQNNTCEIWSSAILFRDERFTEREDFKNMIKAKYDEGIPVYVDYVSITPTDIECTEEQSQILDELTNARTYKNVTNITTDSKAILSLDYVKDLETLLTSKESEV